MTKPTYEKMLAGNCRWRSDYKDVGIELSFHGYRPPSEREGMFSYGHGTWCYYIMLNELMFDATDWKKLRFFPHFNDDVSFEVYDYYAFPDVEFHGGITFYEVTKHYNKHVKRHIEVVKAGCDYNHLWDGERGYPDTYESVLFDAERSVCELLKQFPNINYRCGYSGIWDSPSEFFKAKNGRWIHKSRIDELKNLDYMKSWLPEE